MSSLPSKIYLHEEESLSPECRDLISTLPKEKGWILSNLYQYQGFWYPARSLEATLSCQKHMLVQHSDIFLVTMPKSGTTWLKSIIFTLLNRKRYDPVQALSNNHPLLTQNPHHLVPFLEVDLYADGKIPDIVSLSSPRLFAAHSPYVSFPESAKSKACKIVYLCRNPKDTFVSLWHFMTKLRAQEMGRYSISEAFDMFCKGVSAYGPYWDHVLDYWKQSKEDPSRVFFLKYEDMREEPGIYVRRLAEFLECPFSVDEEELGMVDQILKVCSFDHLSSLKVNKNESLWNGIENNVYFRKGEVGDWKNYLDAQMASRIDQISQEKFHGSGLVLY